MDNERLQFGDRTGTDRVEDRGRFVNGVTVKLTRSGKPTAPWASVTVSSKTYWPGTEVVNDVCCASNL